MYLSYNYEDSQLLREKKKNKTGGEKKAFHLIRGID